MIAIPNLGAGNFASVVRMIEKASGQAMLVDDPTALKHADKVILAGVGAFDNGMRSLRENGWVEPLAAAVHGRAVPLLGICLGMQLLCERSDEGRLAGLGWLDAEVKRFVPTDPTIKVPHMGWNNVEVKRANPLLDDSDSDQRFYFVHSYYVACRNPEDVIATARHGQLFDAVVSRGNVFGVQFHPEKSHRFGLAVLRRFVELPC